eukprot:TRINITY_DN2677_c0_g2_i1.p1 TRINITY_DN2677_c0_g2~~TRINITY_DN2677_c0_g2_i1.p1  ORF type:complete len:206 (+),score=32.83 TRINITY_DN2677_c0_g2_i1:73-690(+)
MSAMLRGPFVLALVASWTLCANGSRRADEAADDSQCEDIPGDDDEDDDEEDQTSFKSWMRDFSPVGSLLQQGVAAHASSLVNATTRAPHIKLEVSLECVAKTISASKYCLKESLWFYKCVPPLTEEDAERSFPLDEVCLEEVRKHSALKDVKTGCCNDHPDYEGGCCKATKVGVLVAACMLMLPFVCCCCCGGLIVMALRSRQSS